MLAEEQGRVVVVLVRARNPANIGAVARAMHDLGYSQLRVVNDYPVPFAAARSAVDASSVLAAAVELRSVAEAVADCSLVVGTTAVGERALEHPLHELREAAHIIRGTLHADARARVALLFGSEKTGLSNEELSHCNALLTIPMNTRSAEHHLSMNLGQATAVCLYEITQISSSSTLAGPSIPPRSGSRLVEDRATAGELQRITTLLQRVLHASGYSRRHPANTREASVRRMVRRLGLTAVDATVWMGVLRQLLHALDQIALSSDAEESHE